MSEESADVFPKHPEVERDIDVIPVTNYTKDNLLTAITERVPHVSIIEGEAIPQSMGVSLESGDKSKSFRLFIFPFSESEHRTIAGLFMKDKKSLTATLYQIKENADPDNMSLSLTKRIMPPGYVEGKSEFPPSEEGQLIELLQKTHTPEEAEAYRKSLGHVILDQLGSVGDVMEGEIQDIIEEISKSKVIVN